jgi:GTP-binding protein
VADIPGLIEGAAEGAGIGDRFLGHIERCRVLLHLVDASGDDPIDAYDIVCGELENYGAGLVDKPQIVALNKVDAVDAKTADKLAKKLAKKSGVEVMRLSGATGEGLERVLDKIIEILGPASEKAAMSETESDEPWSPI